MDFHIEVSESLNCYSSYRASVYAGIHRALRKIGKHADIRSIDISVEQSSKVHFMTGVGGMCFGPDRCSIYVNPNYRYFTNGLLNTIAAVTVHELNHCLRFGYFPEELQSSNKCAGSELVTEGLASNCETFLGFPKPATILGLVEDDVFPHLMQIAPIISDNKANWHWIYTLMELPMHCYQSVYPMGYFLVKRYLEKSGKDPFECYMLPWQEIWENALKN